MTSKKNIFSQKKMMELTQRISDVAYKWAYANVSELIQYKKSRESFEQVDLETLENSIEFTSLYYCNVKYMNTTHLVFTFGYRLKFKPEYFKKILYELFFHENEFNPDIIKENIDKLVNNFSICKLCDNNNVSKIEYNNMCKHCYIFGTVNEDDSCAICLENDFGVWLVTPCNHRFHYRCYNKTVEKSCPLCRTFIGNNTNILDY